MKDKADLKSAEDLANDQWKNKYNDRSSNNILLIFSCFTPLSNHGEKSRKTC